MYKVQDSWKGWQIDIWRHNIRGIGIDNISPTAATNWPTANKAYYYQIYLPYPVLCKKFFWRNGTSVTGNADMGIFAYPSGIKISSTGSIALAGVSEKQFASPTTGPFWLSPGQYWLGISTSSTGRISYFATSLAGARLIGGAQETSAFTLPDTITPAQMSGTFLVPMIGISTVYNIGDF